MKKYIVLIMVLFSVSILSFADCSRGKITNNSKNYFNKIAGYWQPEQEMGSLFEIRKIGKDWYYIFYHFHSGKIEKHKIDYLKNGVFVRISSDGYAYYKGYDTKLDAIVSVGEDLCIIGDSGRVGADEIDTVYSKEGYTNVRTGPSKSHKVKGQIPDGTKVLYAEYSEHNDINPKSDWMEVMYFNLEKNIIGEGFIHKSQIK